MFSVLGELFRSADLQAYGDRDCRRYSRYSWI